MLFLQVREVGDGNINYVYIVEGPSGGVVLKQGLPYIRIAHDWPLTQVRFPFNASSRLQRSSHCRKLAVRLRTVGCADILLSPKAQ